ncbi:GNAT family N-acetyltransferase [Myxococcus stipitatus]|uniref:GNAT family N-acetyltransferase n=1 Tax=Myxococcus stipitatus TaxID=83455 RepID=UPI001F1E29CF|nr:GNAT family N-acetyltransferase [Myxococcus stipitatus]MCE9670544.1 GNAT family N-acetyltransferase [Myxococcus stipitatus]
MDWVCGPNEAMLRAWFTATLALSESLPDARRYAAARGDELLASAVLSPPSQKPGVSRQLRWLLATGRACGWRCVQRTLRYLRATEPLKPSGHWTLEFIGVASQARGQGLARVLLERIERSVPGAPLFLTTADPRNVPMYRHLGFIERHALELDGLSITAMTRAPRDAEEPDTRRP